MIEDKVSIATAQTPLIHVVDDDSGMRASLEDLLASVGYEVASFGSTIEVLAAVQTERPDCLILDVRLPGVSGLDFQDQMARNGQDVPVILVTGYGDVPMSVRGMKAGAIDFIEKPFREQDLLDAVANAVAENRRRLPLIERREEARQLFANLSPREREVIEHVLQGLLNKQIAYALSLSEVTVKIHRASAMRKLGAKSLVELTRLADLLGT